MRVVVLQDDFTIENVLDDVIAADFDFCNDPLFAVVCLGTRTDAVVLFEFTIDYAVCIFCGFCEEACPEEAIYMSDQYDITMLDRKKMKYNMEQLLVPVSELKDRMEFCRKMYGKWNY